MIITTINKMKSDKSRFSLIKNCRKEKPHCEEDAMIIEEELNKESFVRLEICTIMERITYTTGHIDDYSNHSFTNSHSYLA